MSKLEELRTRNADALLGGGEQQILAQHDAGKKTARERIGLLLDQGSFVEIDKFLKRTYTTPGLEAASETGEGVVCGYGTIAELPVFVFAQDYTVLKGSLSSAHASKILKTMDMAVKNGVPVIGVLDSGGARISEGMAAISATAEILKKLSDISGVIPTVSIVAGACIGTAAYIAALTDFTLMIDGISQLALHGPQIYASAMGKEIDAQALFGAKSHNKNTGVAQFMCADEMECMGTVRKLLSYLPSNNLDEAPYEMNTDDLNRQLSFGEEVPDMKELIRSVADNGDVLAYQADFASEVITMFGRLNGNVCGFIANDSTGVLTQRASKKAARFLSFLDAYNIPAVTFTNCGSSDVDIEKEQGSLIPDFAKLVSAYATSGMPKLNVIVGKAIGDGFAVMCPKALGADMVYAWPSAHISAMPVEAGALLLYEEEIAKADDGIAAKKQMIDKYLDEYANPWQAAEQGVVDDVIEPAHTRQVLIASLEMVLSKREEKLPKKHGVLPL
ncbi:MAG: carboxyl transferase domain-containing protein [Christensenella sp.]|uniref:acyl-CoA carboxylase subunit beta n=1 Tax=Christensenella sp. TaxID=1935934 RepID=UPI002B202C12|nr:carboxyl transferase domain-containing protein [Christensenella sp.]MEA5003856.1 carboxyl transferase domain-containing protein [Christensenella sp.]